MITAALTDQQQNEDDNDDDNSSRSDKPSPHSKGTKRKITLSYGEGLNLLAAQNSASEDLSDSDFSQGSDEDNIQSPSSEARDLADLVSEEDRRDNIRRKRQLKPHSIVMLTLFKGQEQWKLTNLTGQQCYRDGV